jgi:hypothetical protein
MHMSNREKSKVKTRVVLLILDRKIVAVSTNKATVAPGGGFGESA